MFVVAKTPLRISLAGGSVDLSGYLEKYGIGNVVSFTPNLFTYIILKSSADDFYKIIYSKIEKESKISNIKNDIARIVLGYFDMPPVEVMFTADIPSSGSGLASSSSYLISLIEACCIFKNQHLTTQEIGVLAMRLERKFNPLTGYQDIYGCLLPGFKSMQFTEKGLDSVKYLSTNLFKHYDMHLVSTNGVRSSTSVLETLDFYKIHDMASITPRLLNAITDNELDTVLNLILKGWQQKKLTSPAICNDDIREYESKFLTMKDVLSWRLIGAGNGGYFLLITNKYFVLPIKSFNIELYEEYRV